MAADEFGSHGFDVEVISADHQNKPDLGASIAGQWYDRDGVDMFIDVPTSSVALAVAGVAKQKNKLFVAVGAASSELSGGRLRAERDPLHLRHLHAGEVDRRRHREGGRRHLVFHHRRLCLRQAVAGRHDRVHHRRRRQGAGQFGLSVPGHDRLLVVPGAGPGHAAPRCSASAMPAPTR